MVKQWQADTAAKEDAGREEPGAMSADGGGLGSQTEPQGAGEEKQEQGGPSRHEDAGTETLGQ